MNLNKEERFQIMNKIFHKDILFPQYLYKIKNTNNTGIKDEIQGIVCSIFQKYKYIKVGMRSVMKLSKLCQDPVELPFEKKNIKKSLAHYYSLFLKSNSKSELSNLSAILLSTLPTKYGVTKSNHCAGKLKIIIPSSIKDDENIRLNLEILPNEFYTRNIEFAKTEDLIIINEDFGRSLNITGCINKISNTLLVDIIKRFYSYLDIKYNFKSSLRKIYNYGGEVIDFTLLHNRKKITNIYLFDF